MTTSLTQSKPLRHFARGLGALLDEGADEPRILRDGGALLAELVAHDDWLPESHAQPDSAHYCQYLLHLDERERFSVVSFVWGPGQETPIHDHTVWGLVGMLRGEEWAQNYRLGAGGRPEKTGAAELLLPGQVVAVSPRIGDIHRVANALTDRASISIHVYGGNIGRIHRSVFGDDGTVKPFVSGYTPAIAPAHA
jgi:predicted metal-dependent enzyme (double-stranded beta helix superfamily)